MSALSKRAPASLLLRIAAKEYTTAEVLWLSLKDKTMDDYVTFQRAIAAMERAAILFTQDSQEE
jgi:hypothetical protein